MHIKSKLIPACVCVIVGVEWAQRNEDKTLVACVCLYGVLYGALHTAPFTAAYVNGFVRPKQTLLFQLPSSLCS